MRARMKGEVERGVMRGEARAAYLAICLDLAPDMRARHGEEWGRAVAALEKDAGVLRALFYEAPVPAGEALRAKALAAGVKKPERK